MLIHENLDAFSAELHPAEPHPGSSGLHLVEPLRIPSLVDTSWADVITPCGGGVCAAVGIRATGISAGFRKNPERLDFALVVADKACTCAGTFTQNRFCAAPVQVSRPRASAGCARAVMLNSGNANAATGNQGVEVALESSRMVAKALGCVEEEVLVASTGVIGVPLGVEPFKSGIPCAIASLGSTPEHANRAATAVMTTDTHPKESAYAATIPAHAYENREPLAGDDEVIAKTDETLTERGEVVAVKSEEAVIHVGGFVKGSGMIQPNMATMLAVITTDAALTPEAAHEALLAAVQTSFNKVTVDSDTSTNDSCFLLATGAVATDPIELDSAAYPIVVAALRAVAEDLACQIAADGEGATKLITVDVIGAANDDDADTVARSIANSPLVKTAIFGHDANWGRIADAAGKCGVAFDQYDVDIDLMGVPMCRGGLPVPFDEDEMLTLFEEPEISIVVNLGMGTCHTRMWTCDLTHDYININADYRT